MKPLYLLWILFAVSVAACQSIQPEGSMAQPGAATALTRQSAAVAVENGALSTALQSQLYNQRVSMSPGISSSTIANLNLTWFAPTDGMISHRALLGDGRIYVADWDGKVYAMDAQSGHELWKKQIEQNVQSKWPWYGFAGTGDLGGGKLYEASVEGTAYAIDPKNGNVLWKTSIADNPYAGNVGQLLYYDGMVYIGLSSVEEVLSEMEGITPTFQGSVVALNAQDGSVAWKRPLVEAPHTGVAVWSSFALDPQMNALFFTTGNNYTGKATSLSDSMVAVNAKTGEILWSYQVTPNDVWTLSARVGPDYDFGGGPQLFDATIDGQTRHLVGAGQKSGFYSVFDRESGEHVWSTYVGYGGVGGGIRGEASVADGTLYLWSNNAYEDGQPPENYPLTVKALDTATGTPNWFQDKIQPANSSSAGFLANDVYFVDSLNGIVQAYRAGDGAILWHAKLPGAIGAPLWVSGDTLYVAAGLPAIFGGMDGGNGLYAFSLGGTPLTGTVVVTGTGPVTGTEGMTDGAK
jgi:polyvinyl alcohol dehydrogenase (cytochrome)